ncbi:MAG TPA: nucleotidyltransferase domain-containing protein, partial [Terriglobia bacterium]|nr:nucleotidyltransferase domain-containing protein [Terriglobia bacterium]
MNSIADLLAREPDPILFECVAGSVAYGTRVTGSDEDIRGLFAVPSHAYLDLVRPPEQVGDDRNNVVYYSLRRFVELLAGANPNILELLFMPEDCVRRTTPEMALLQTEARLFITKQCAKTHAGYAMTQIRKARGQNKWINNPKPEAAPGREDFDGRWRQQDSGELDFDAKNMM